jgi:hypothetical protein
MKSFIDYIAESVAEKKYTFKIKIAGDLPDNCEDVMEAALQQFNVARFTKGKNTPIQANLLDFPNVKNASMCVFEAEVDYPTTSAIVAELISNKTGISRDCVCVRTPIEEANWEIENENALTDKNDKKEKTSLLTKGYEKETHQDLMGEKQVSNFLKELTKARKENKVEQVKGINDQLLAKKAHTEKAESMPAAGPARSVLGSKK